MKTKIYLFACLAVSTLIISCTSDDLEVTSTSSAKNTITVPMKTSADILNEEIGDKDKDIDKSKGNK